MNTHIDKKKERTSKSATNDLSLTDKREGSTLQFVDHKPAAIAQRKIQEMANNSSRAIQLKALQEIANSSPQSKQITQLQSIADREEVQQQSFQKKENTTGLPDNLKTGIEHLSGLSLNDVKVYRNSDKPAQLQAHAYAQGTEIHLGPGQEKHLPHEAWHVVQQKQGRVKPTMQMKGKVNINDDDGLEREADIMGNRALQLAHFDSLNVDNSIQLKVDKTSYTNAPIQMVKEAEFVADPEDFMSKNVILFEYGKGFYLKFPNTVEAINGAISENNLVANIKLLMASKKDEISFYLQDSGTTATDDKTVYFTTPALGLLTDVEIKSIFKNGNTFLDNADELVRILKRENGHGDKIRANYAPYMIGNPNLQPDGNFDEDVWNNVGSTVVDPTVTKFVFTDAMNGCAYGITKVNGSDIKFEAWHFQSETDNFSQASHFRATKKIRDWFGVNDYYIGDGSTNLAATNIIWNSDGGSKMLSQKNVIPLDGVGKTEFLESTSHDLNVTDDISEENLGLIHEKLMTGTRGNIKQSDIISINKDLEALSTRKTNVNASKSLEIIKDSSDKMEQNEVTELYKISNNIKSFKKQYTATNLGIYVSGLESIGDGLTSLSSSSFFGGISYTKDGIIPLKRNFKLLTNAFLSEVVSDIGNSKQVVITNSHNELNENVIEQCLRIKFHYDIYEDYGDEFRRLDRIINGLNRLASKKKAVTKKQTMLTQEKKKLFP